MSKSGKKFSCSIYDYLERRHEKVHEVIKDLCLGGALKPFRGVGVTFVIPAGKTVDEVSKLVASDNENDWVKGAEIIKSHILQDCYGPNNLLKEAINKNNKKIIASSSNKSGVQLGNGTNLTFDAGFRTMPDRELSAVMIADGPMPMDGEVVKAPRAARGKKTAADVVEGSGDNDVDRNSFAAALNNCADSDKGAFCLSSVLSLMIHLADKPSRDCALASLDLSPYTSYYLLLEPYSKDRSNHVISNDDLSDWKPSMGKINTDSMKEYVKLIEEAGKLLTGGIKEIDEMVDDIRWSITSGGIAKSHIMRSINDAYTTNVPKMYKDAALGSCMSAGQFKLWQDQARFHINYMITYWEQDLLSHRHDWSSIDTSIQSLMSTTTPYLTKMTEKAITSNEDFFAGPVAFIESKSFLYFPATKSEIASAGMEEGFYGAHQDVVAECAGAGSGRIETLESCAGMQ